MKNTDEHSILLIEDNPGDSRLIKEMLKEIATFDYQLIIAETLHDGCEQINNNNFIIILLDLNLPDSIGKETFDTVIKFAKNIPVVLVSALQNVELSISLIKEGAQDYILKWDLNGSILDKTIQFAIERKKLLNELNKKTHELHELNSYFIGRESRMIELKKEVNELAVKLGEEKRYDW